MVMIPQDSGVQTVLPDRIVDATQRPDVTPGAFGGQVSQAVGGLAQPLDQIKQTYDQVAANEATNQYMTGAQRIIFGDPSSGQPGFNALKGQAALQAAPVVQKQLTDLYSTLQGSMATNDQAAQFERSTKMFQNRDLSLVASRTSDAASAFANDSDQGTIDLSHQQASLHNNDPDTVTAMLQRSTATVRAMAARNGTSPAMTQVLVNQDRSQALSAIVQAAAGDSPERAQSLLVSFRPQMDADSYARLSESLQPKVYDDMGKRITQSIVNNPSRSSIGIPGDADIGGVWHSMKGIESGGNQFSPAGTPIVSPVGGPDAPVGISQIRPSSARGAAAAAGIVFDPTRLQNDPVYNEQLGKEYLLQQMQRYGGNKTLAVAAYDAGPGNVDTWLKTIGDPRDGKVTDSQFAAAIPFQETRNYVTRVASENGGSSAPLAPAGGAGGVGSASTAQPTTYQAPDLGSMLATAQARTAGLPPEVQDRVISGVQRAYQEWQISTQSQRMALEDHVRNVSAQFMAGDTTAGIPEQQIRSLYPADKAQEMVDDLHVRQQAGIAFKGALWASPAEEQATLAQLQDPNSVQAAAMRANRGLLVGPGVVPAGTGSASGGVAPAVLTGGNGAPAGPRTAAVSDESYSLQQRIAQAYTAMLQQKHAALAADPAGYAAANPQVKTAASAIDERNPSTFENYLNVLKSVQQRLGVQAPRLLSNDQASSLMQKITTADPSKVDIGQVLDATAQQYGQMWPQVFGELAKKGLPTEYQTLAAMDTPGQASARADFQRSLQAPFEQLKSAAGVEAKGLIDGGSSNSPIETALNPFKRTVMMNTGGAQLYSAVRSSVQRLAYYYAGQGQDGGQALDNAMSGVLGRYEFAGTMRVPRGMLSQVQTAAWQMQEGLGPNDLAPEAGNRDLTQAQRQQIATGAAQNGSWVPNADDTGLTLMGQYRNGKLAAMMGANGQPISIRFADVAAGKYAAPPDTFSASSKASEAAEIAPYLPDGGGGARPLQFPTSPDWPTRPSPISPMMHSGQQ